MYYNYRYMFVYMVLMNACISNSNILVEYNIVIDKSQTQIFGKNIVILILYRFGKNIGLPLYKPSSIMCSYYMLQNSYNQMEKKDFYSPKFCRPSKMIISKRVWG